MVFLLILLLIMIAGAGISMGISITAIVERLSMWNPYGILGLVFGALLFAAGSFYLLRLFVAERDSGCDKNERAEEVVE